MHAAGQLGRTNRRSAPIAAADQAALAFLSEILLGDSSWTLAEVQGLISMRESAELGRWRVAGPDDDAVSAS
jgi:hypothetical protein